jgi:rhamnose transport system permease protein
VVAASLARLRPIARWETGLVLLAACVLIFGTSTSPEFVSSRNFFYMSLNVGEVAIMTLPMALIVISGEIDLSVASTLGMSSALLGFLWIRGWPMPAVLVAVLAAGAIAGLFNAVLITRLGLPSLAVTIGTLTLYRGVALILLGPNSVSSFPVAYTNVGILPFPGTDIPYSVVIFLVLAVLVGITLHATPVGRAIFAIGLNKEAAAFSGIRVRRIKTVLYVVSGVLSALAGILFTFRLATAISNNGTGLELDVVAVVLFAGVSIFGGTGTIVGLVLAIFTFAAMQNALLLANFNERAAGIVTGSLLLASVLVPTAVSYLSRLRRGLNGPTGVSAAEQPMAEPRASASEQPRAGLESATARDRPVWRANQPGTANGG